MAMSREPSTRPKMHDQPHTLRRLRKSETIDVPDVSHNISKTQLREHYDKPKYGYDRRSQNKQKMQRSCSYDIPDQSRPLQEKRSSLGQHDKSSGALTLFRRSVKMVAKPPPCPAVKLQNSEEGDKHRAPIMKNQSVTGFVNKHVANIRRLYKQKSLDSASVQNSLYTSCPDLTQEEMRNNMAKQQVRISRSSDVLMGRTPHTNPLAIKDTTPKLLTVPNVFTTSFTRSPDLHQVTFQNEISGSMKSTKNYSHSSSAPELMSLDSTERNQHLSRTQKESQENAEEEKRNEPQLYQVLDYLFFGNIEAAYHERKLCRAAIGSIVDVSNIDPDDVPTNKKCDAPCICQSPIRHTQATLRLPMYESEIVDFHHHFRQINKFIEGARKNNKKVLVHCVHGNNMSLLIVIQYLMMHKQMNLRKAYSLVMKHRSDIDLKETFKQLLQNLEKQLFPASEQSLCFEPVAKLVRQRSVPKEAWTQITEC